MHGQYNGSQQVICSSAENMATENSSFGVHKQFDESFGLAFGNSTLILAEWDAESMIFYIVLLQLLLGLAHMCKSRVGEDSPWDSTVIERLGIAVEGIMCGQLTLLRGNMGELIGAGNIARGPDMRYGSAQGLINDNALFVDLYTGSFQV